MYIDILKVLAHYRPLKLTHVMYNANVNCSVLKRSLDALIQRDLVEEQTLRKKRRRTIVVYTTTERSKTVLRYFRELNRALREHSEGNQDPEEIQGLLEVGFEYVCEKDSLTFFKKRKCIGSSENESRIRISHS